MGGSAYVRTMQTIIVKCVQLFCITLLFENVFCDNIPLNASRDDVLLYHEIGCGAACMVKHVSAVCMN